MIEFLIFQRYGRAGLAHSAADQVSEAKGEQWQMAFRPRGMRDQAPYIIERVSA